MGYFVSYPPVPSPPGLAQPVGCTTTTTTTTSTTTTPPPACTNCAGSQPAATQSGVSGADPHCVNGSMPFLFFNDLGATCQWAWGAVDAFSPVYVTFDKTTHVFTVGDPVWTTVLSVNLSCAGGKITGTVTLSGSSYGCTGPATITFG